MASRQRWCFLKIIMHIYIERELINSHSRLIFLCYFYIFYVCKPQYLLFPTQNKRKMLQTENEFSSISRHNILRTAVEISMCRKHVYGSWCKTFLKLKDYAITITSFSSNLESDIKHRLISLSTNFIIIYFSSFVYLSSSSKTSFLQRMWI